MTIELASTKKEKNAVLVETEISFTEKYFLMTDFR